MLILIGFETLLIQFLIIFYLGLFTLFLCFTFVSAEFMVLCENHILKKEIEVKSHLQLSDSMMQHYKMIWTLKLS